MSKKSFFNRLAERVARIETIENKLGVPTRKTIAIRKSVLLPGQIVPELKDHWLRCLADQQEIPQQILVGQLNYTAYDYTINISIDDVYIEIPRVYEPEFLSRDIEFYILNPQKGPEGRIIGGEKFKFLFLKDQDPVYLGIMLRKFHDKDPMQVI